MSIIEDLLGQFESKSKKSFTPAILARLDTGEPSRIVFQFEPGTFQKTVTSTYGSGTSMNRAHPIIQFSNGDQEEITFQARFYSRHKDENLQPYLDALMAAVRRDPDLGRPPIWAFIWGEPILDQVVVKSISPMTFDSMKPDGTVRDIGFSITLLRYEQYDIEITDPNERPRDTFYRVVQTGDTYESMAKRQYGDPMKGDLLRRLNPSRPWLVLGERVKLLDPERFEGVVVTPESPPLERSAAGIKALNEVLEERSNSKYSVIVKV